MEFLEPLTNSLHDLSRYFFDASQRIYLIYLAGAVLLAIPVFIASKKNKSFVNFFKFLFPRKIWLASSAKQDYVLLVVNKIIKGVLLAPIILVMVPVALAVTDVLEWALGAQAPLTTSKTIVMISFTSLLFVLDDLSRFILHWMLHKIPFLWEIHKVHHSAKVLTPFTIYRSHPVENYLFACRLALAQGLAVGVSYYLFGPTLSVIEFAGANIFVFAFNFMGSNLRHSHIWLSWGNKVEHWLVSPAQHQIHHSDNPAHFDSNLGSALAIWDRMAGTLITADKVNNIHFGVGRDFNEHDTVAGIYWNPLKSSAQRFLSMFRVGFFSKN
ncbi:sterol desaturase family protein [Aliikangiella coralliicola]|uniref:Sterol desaturase family protein n=1 Tax=Aliikangiella coralliicola TaxID=2592383 RepID=A0A545UC99_9GAMM|nr:sterol desaturase family protein [Aliikangiella coralliicola]TQV87090.1 sterol desaturase family protein [Aliikangiella coralliicola]